MSILIIDNYDSFVHNIARYCRQLGKDCKVIRNDAITVKEIKQLKLSHIILSPGPGAPDNAGVCLEVIKTLYQDIPILGICLGHQAIGHAFGGSIEHAKKPMHGRASNINHNAEGIFKDLQNPMRVGRYHSLIVSGELDADIQITATSDEGEIMALAHKDRPLHGVQFHPESILTTQGYDLIYNFLKL